MNHNKSTSIHLTPNSTTASAAVVLTTTGMNDTTTDIEIMESHQSLLSAEDDHLGAVSSEDEYGHDSMNDTAGSTAHPKLASASASALATASFSPPDSDPALESALESAGLGRFHALLIALCGFAIASDSVEVRAVSFVVASQAECDLGLDSVAKGWVSAGTFLGMLFGGVVWGAMADGSMGRRRTLALALGLNAVFSAASAGAETFGAFFFLRIVSGIGVGGSIPVVFSYVTEFLPPARRGSLTVVVASCWMLGSVLSTGMAWGLIGANECDHSIGTEEGGNNGGGASAQETAAACAAARASQCEIIDLAWGPASAWRVYTIVTSLPAALAALAFALLAPPSPRWLLLRGQRAQAAKVLTRAAKVNGRTPPKPEVLEALRVSTHSQHGRGIRSLSLSAQAATLGGGARGYLRAINGLLKNRWQTIAPIFGVYYRRSVLVLCGVWFLLSYGAYGLTMWLPTYFEHGGIPEPDNMYPISMAVAAAALPGNLVSLWTVERFGRRITLVVCMAIGGLSVLGVALVHDTVGVTLLSCAFSALTVGGWNALDLLSAESFDTRLRASAFGVQSAAGRIGAICGTVSFGAFGPADAAVPLALVAAMLIAGGLLTLMLKETKGLEMA